MFEGRIWVLVASVPDLWILCTFIMYLLQKKNVVCFRDGNYLLQFNQIISEFTDKQGIA